MTQTKRNESETNAFCPTERASRLAASTDYILSKKHSVQRIGTVNKGANGFVTEGQQFLKSVCPYHSCCVPIKVQIDQEKYIVTRENRLNRFNTRWRDFL